MRDIAAPELTALVAELYQQANYFLPEEVLSCLRQALDEEESLVGRNVLETLIQNAAIAARERVPLCQDTGVAVVFVEMGQDARLVGATLEEAVDAGIRRAVAEGYLRASVVTDPVFDRANSGDNTPAVTHVDLAAGNGIRVTVLPKGAGSENKSRVAMLNPHDGAAGIADFVVETVERAGAAACPPLFLGIGIGGTMDHAALLSKKALLRPAGSPNPEPPLAELEAEIRARVNALGIGPGGLGGTVTCLGAAIETAPCHIASLPVSVSIQCNSARRATGSL